MDLVVVLQLLGMFSLFMFVGSLIVIPLLINRLRVHYFITHNQKVCKRKREHPLLALIIFFCRNFIGIGLFAAGLTMLFLPGQGLLTMIIGICVMDFPGKQHFVEWLVLSEKVRHSLNWVRKKGGKQPFVFE